MWEFNHREGWVPKNWCFWTVVLEKTLESPLDSKEIQRVNPKGNQSWIFIGRTDAEAEAPILWPPDVKNWLVGKDPDAGKDWKQEEKGMTEDEMVGWYHQLNGHEFEQAPGVGDGQGSLVCGSLCGCKELDTTEPLNCFSFYVIVHWFVSQFKPTLLTPILVNILFWLLKYIWKYSGNFNSFHLILFFYDFYLFIGIHH